MEPGITGALIGAAILTIAFCAALAVVVWLARSTIKGFRSNRPEPMAWLRTMMPEHEALPTPTPQAPLLHGPGPSKRARFQICLAQLAFIAVLTYGMSVPPEGNPAPINPSQVVVSFWIAVLMAAFFTALLTRLWDRTSPKVEGVAIFSTPAAIAPRAEHHEPAQEGDRVGARLGVREIRKTPSSLWRGQQRG